MNIKKIIYLLMLTLSMFFLACENTLYDDVVDDRVYIVNPGLNEIDIGNSGSYTHGIYVVKSGVGQQEAKVRLEVSQSLLDTYNENNGTDYQLLPAQYFTISIGELIIENEEYREAFEVVFDVEGITTLKESSDVAFAVPCEMISSNAEIGVEKERMTSIIVPMTMISDDDEI